MFDFQNAKYMQRCHTFNGRPVLVTFVTLSELLNGGMKKPWLFRVYRDHTTQLYGIILNHSLNPIPILSISIMECHKGSGRCSIAISGYIYTILHGCQLRFYIAEVEGIEGYLVVILSWGELGDTCCHFMKVIFV